MKKLKQKIEAVKELRQKVEVIQEIINKRRRNTYKQYGKSLVALKKRLEVLENEIFS